MQRKIALWLGLGLFVAGCTDGDFTGIYPDLYEESDNGNDNGNTNGNGDNSPGDGSIGSGSDALSQTERELVIAINAERSKRGLTPVEAVPVLTCAARMHSADIGPRGACSHSGSDGSDPGDRVMSCSGNGWSGEIVACGHSTPAQAVSGWLDSPGHRNIMLDPGQRKIGVGMQQNFWTAIFNSN